ncbi:type II CRISPR-associated endonuclease Cas1 [uncultured Anaerovibrio sp.]|jgi:CRISPR-associated protein Cas1|uniref:type II CRISPR-associated endonuclease Cas1 n=1 Tax=uncultured Anaerovibrio sp. TaxID=361586 RepID=UPI0026047F67|nr:type II CRISPR-associated endonuclease Cas1 [uncultured Anaerovibrio sp.]
MAFRTVEITKPTEIHIRSNQLELMQDEGQVNIPVEDIAVILTIGSNIRLSTMDLSILANNHVALVTLDNKYLPTALVLPFEGNTRQSQLIHRQVEFGNENYQKVWFQIIKRKIANQARALSILGLSGAEQVGTYAENLNMEETDCSEAMAAKLYFQHYHEGLNRRGDDPINSRLNYGYAVVRSAICRAIAAVGCHPAFGIHHNNQLNAFNLADDLIEPFRPMVDLVAHENIDSNVNLSKAERSALARVLHNACLVNGSKVSVLYAIELMAESYKRILMREYNEDLVLPTVIPIECLEGITE